jgi:phage terminase large subunit-like protein
MMSARLRAIESYRKALDLALDRGVEHDVERHLCKTDLFYLLTVVLGRADLNHDWLFARCREVQAEPNGYLDLWARDHRKSSIITFGLTIQDILNDPEITVGLLSVTNDIATAFLRQIKRELETNERLLALFPDILWARPDREAPKWSERDGIIVKRKTNPKESTVEASGLVDGQPTSRHYKLLVYDDVVTEASITSSEMIAKVTRGWENSLNLSTRGGWIRYIGTRWHHADTYRTIIERGAAIPRRHPITYDGTVTGEPVLLTKEEVAQKRRDQGPYVFGAQQLLDPTADRAQGFREEWLRYYKDRGDSGMNKYIIVDAANSRKKGSDYTAMGVIGLASDDNYYLLDGIRDRLSLTERGDALFALHRRWKPQGVGYEEYGMMSDIEYIEERQAQENYRFGITKLAGKTPKPDRIRWLVPVFEAGRFWFPESLIKSDYEGIRRDLIQTFLIDEYHPFPVGLHDDFFDMLSRIRDPDMLTIWPKPVVKEDRYARDRIRRRTTSAWAA